MKRTLWVLGLGVLLIATAARDAGATAPVRVAVTSVSGRDVFIDAGSSAGITPGLRVRFFPAGAPPFEAVVADVSSGSARVQLNGGTLPPPVGTAGEILVPDAPPAAASQTTAPATQPDQTAPPTAVPEHPPWARVEGGRNPDMPLLAPAFSRPPSERPSTFHGRVFGAFDYSMDAYQGRDSRYLLGRTGTSWTLTNPFGQGGSLYFDGEFDHRGSDLTSASSASDDLILNRFSYAIGEERYAPYRLEFGRFISRYLPEIGFVDGVEGAVRFENGVSVGGGLGGYPRPFVRRREGEDVGFHTFVDYASPAPRGFTGTLGYQKTWHDGVPDRDLIVGRGSAWLTDKLWVFGSARLDVYGDHDVLKSPGPHLTDAWFQTRYTPDSTRGVSAGYSHYTWADVLAPEFALVPPDLIRKGRVDRVEVTAWRDLAPNLRPTGRVSYFTDQQGSGYAGEIDLDRTNLFDAFDLHGDVFYSRGSFTNDYGFRTEGRWHHDAWSAFLGYEWYRYRGLDGFMGSSGGYLTRNTIRAGLGWQRGPWYYSFEADHYFGDRDRAYLFNFYAEYRF